VRGLNKKCPSGFAQPIGRIPGEQDPRGMLSASHRFNAPASKIQISAACLSEEGLRGRLHAAYR